MNTHHSAAFLRYLVGVSELETPQYVAIVDDALEKLKSGQIKKRTELLMYVTSAIERKIE